VLSNKNKPLYHYFKQLFAQVTNPAIDPIREELVMSLVSFIGPKPNLLGIDELNPPLRLEVSQPVVDFFEMEKIRHIERYTGGKFRSLELDITYPAAWGKEAVETHLASLCAQAEDAVRSGYSIIVISDRAVDRERVAIPALLALSAIHQHLVAKGLRTSMGLVVETGSAREVHHFALLGGYGAEAVHPYLAMETLLAANGEGFEAPGLGEFYPEVIAKFTVLGIDFEITRITLILWIVSGSVFLAVGQSMKLPLPLWSPLLLSFVVCVAIMVPSSPGFIGVLEGSCVVGLALVGVDASRALAYGVIYHLTQILPLVVLGGFYALRGRIGRGQLREAGPEAD
jgi:hypothetical protein